MQYAKRPSLKQYFARSEPSQVRRAIPLIPVVATTVGELRGNGGAVEGAKAFLEELQAYRSKNFPTSEEQDKELLR